VFVRIYVLLVGGGDDTEHHYNMPVARVLTETSESFNGVGVRCPARSTWAGMSVYTTNTAQ